MNDIIFSYQESCGIPGQDLLGLASSKQMEGERLKLLALFQKKELYQTPYASLAVPFLISALKLRKYYEIREFKLRAQ